MPASTQRTYCFAASATLFAILAAMISFSLSGCLNTGVSTLPVQSIQGEGRLYGKVVDQNGLPVGMATVTLAGKSASSSYETGKFTFRSLPVGRPYTLTAAKEGYREAAFEVTPGDQLPRDPDAIMVTAVLVQTGAPSIRSLSIQKAVNTGPVTIEISGEHFISGQTLSARLVMVGQPDLTAATVSYLGSTRIRCLFDIAGAFPGLWTLVVENPGGGTATLRESFSITGAILPKVTAITPVWAYDDIADQVISISGHNFLEGPTLSVKLRMTDQSDIAALETAWVHSGQIRAKFDLRGKPSGLWGIEVINPDGKSAELDECFTIKPRPAPVISSVTPASGTDLDSNLSITVSGDFFFPGIQVLLQHSGDTDITANVVNPVGLNSLSCTVDLTGRTRASWDIRVTNSDGQTDVLPGGFAITAPPPPSISGITPATGTDFETARTVSISGQNFRAGISIRLSKVGETDIQGTSTQISGATQASCVFNLLGKSRGAWDLVVENTDGQSATLAGGFTVTAQPPPVVNSVSPGSAVDLDGPVSIFVLGSDFLNGATIVLKKVGETDLPGSAVTFVDSTRLTCSIDITAATRGFWDLVVTNPDSQTVTLTQGFEVTGPPAPTVSGITPSTGTDATSSASVTVTGLNFRNGASVSLVRTGETDIQGSSVSFVGPTSISCTFDLSGKARAAWDVVVTNPDGQSGSLPGGFTITARPAPVVSSISPTSGLDNDSARSVTVTGANFEAGAALKLVRSGEADIAGTGLTVTGPTQITCVLNLAGRATGTWDIVVTNPDSQTGTLAGGFTISARPAPAVSAVTPVSGFANETAKTVTVSGQNFETGALVKLVKSGEADIPATGVNVTGPTQISCVFNLSGKATGAWDIVVTNPDTQSGTLTGGFVVMALPAPSISSVLPNSGTNIEKTKSVTVGGGNFQSGATVKLTRAGQDDIPASNVTVIGTTQITCDFNLIGKAKGSWNLVVTNPDAQSGTLESGFTVESSIADTLLSSIHRHGNSGFRIDAAKTIYFDPYDLSPGLPKADVIFISHEHADHCSKVDVDNIVKTGTVIVTNAASAAELGAGYTIQIVSPGDTGTAGGVTYTAYPAYNLTLPNHPKTDNHLGFVAELSGLKAFHAGDSDSVPEFNGIVCDLVFLPVSGPVMSPSEAATLAETINPTVAIPMHYDGPFPSNTAPEDFKNLLKDKILVEILAKE